MNTNILINGLIFFVCASFFTWRGYKQGVLRSLQRLFCVLAGYAACYFFTAEFAGFLDVQFSFQGAQSYLISALILFFSTGFLVNYSLKSLIDLLEQQDRDPARIPGMLIGAVLGCLFGLITVWLAGIVMDAAQLKKLGSAYIPTEDNDPVRKVAGDMVGGVVGYAVESKMGDDSLAPELAAKLISNPVTATRQLVDVSNSDEFKTFFSDPAVIELMYNNKTSELQQHPAFKKLMALPQAGELLTFLGASVKGVEGADQNEKVARLLTNMYQKTNQIASDPRFIELSKKPEYQQLLQNPSPGVLLTSPALKELAEIVFSENSSVSANKHTGTSIAVDDQHYQSVEKPQWEQLEPTTTESSTADSSEQEAPPAQNNVIYRWTDEHGQKHFSAQKPEGDYPVEVIRTE